MYRIRHFRWMTRTIYTLLTVLWTVVQHTHAHWIIIVLLWRHKAIWNLSTFIIFERVILDHSQCFTYNFRNNKNIQFNKICSGFALTMSFNNLLVHNAPNAQGREWTTMNSISNVGLKHCFASNIWAFKRWLPQFRGLTKML